MMTMKLDRPLLLLLLGVVFTVMSCVAPRFLNAYNMTVIMKSMCLNATVAIGFTLVALLIWFSRLHQGPGTLK